MNEQSPPESRDVFDLDRIHRLIELMERHELTTIELRCQEQRIRLSRGGPAVTASPILAAIPPAPQPVAMSNPPASAPKEVAGDGPNIVFIRSPMVGTFYARSSPEAEPFVKVGSVVDPESTVCTVEAMKVFTEIPAETRGKIVAILAENGKPVEFGKPLFKVDTSL
jgi:acetyl-CoA carboxylase biotin carboxyl carrier protein